MLNLEELDSFLKTATAVVAYKDVVENNAPPGSIAMRHDVDHDLEKALRFAEWEKERGYTSTYFILHTAKYYTSPNLISQLERLLDLGHEVGIHNDAVCAAEGDIGLAKEILYNEIKWLFIDEGIFILGAADHGGRGFSNGSLWLEYTIEDFGLRYEAYQLQRSTTTLLSDNRGRWGAPLKLAQTFMSIHPIWWDI